MKRKITTLLFVLTILFTSNLFVGIASASESTALSSGQKFTVSDITYRVTSDLEVEAISGAMWLREISIPGSVTYNDVSYAVTSIPTGAFYGNYKTTKIVISEGVKTVGASAFQGCDAVTEIELPSTLQSFTTMGFKKLETITLASGSSYFQLKDGVLFTKNGSKLWLYPSAKSGSSYTVPSGTTTIVTSAFYENQHLQTITLPNSVTTIEDYAFDMLNNLTSITFGSNVSSIGKYNLRSCPNLKSLVLKNKGTIGAYSVYDCPALETITIDGNMSGYKEYVFYKLPNLKKYEVKNSPYYQDEDGVLFNKGQLLRYPSAKTNAQYIVPEGTTKIAGLAFNYMKHTKEVILTPGVYVEVMAFHYPNTTSPMTVYFRDKSSVSMSKSSSGVFVGLVSGSKVYLPSTAALTSFQSYKSAVNPKSAVTASVKTIPATAIKLNRSELELKTGESFSLTGTLTPYYSTEDIQWKSSDSDIATVSADGVVTGVKKGRCKITATTDSGVSKSCTVTILKKEVIEPTVDKDSDKTPAGTAGSKVPDKTTTGSTVSSNKNEDKGKDKNTSSDKPVPEKDSKEDTKKDTPNTDSDSKDEEKEESLFDEFVNIFTEPEDSEAQSGSENDEEKDSVGTGKKTGNRVLKTEVINAIITLVLVVAVATAIIVKTKLSRKKEACLENAEKQE